MDFAQQTLGSCIRVRNEREYHLRSSSTGSNARDRCGTGTNAIWLAERGFQVLGVDVAPLAIERAEKKLDRRDLHCHFATLDIVSSSPPDGPFQFVFDRGCFHVFDEPDERAKFAVQVAAALAPAGLWLSLIGSTEGSPREVCPPRRSAQEITVLSNHLSRSSSSDQPSSALTIPRPGSACRAAARSRHNRRRGTISASMVDTGNG
jgi:SAM-dependent methyltransferase